MYCSAVRSQEKSARNCAAIFPPRRCIIEHPHVASLHGMKMLRREILLIGHFTTDQWQCYGQHDAGNRQ